MFSGAGVMTMALHLLSVPALRPWDVGAGEKWNVLTEGGVLIRLAEDNRLGGSHIGTPCISFSWARVHLWFAPPK